MCGILSNMCIVQGNSLLFKEFSCTLSDDLSALTLLFDSQFFIIINPMFQLKYVQVPVKKRSRFGKDSLCGGSHGEVDVELQTSMYRDHVVSVGCYDFKRRDKRQELRRNKDIVTSGGFKVVKRESMWAVLLDPGSPSGYRDQSRSHQREGPEE